MLGKMLGSEMDSLLQRQVFGRLGCHADGETYVVPINYVYRDGTIYAQSGLGKKISMMRTNPKVCFQVDEILNTFSWKSVIMTGEFYEIKGADERKQVLEWLSQNLNALAKSPENKPEHAIPSVSDHIHENVEIIVYKITVQSRSGRFEQKDAF